MNTTTSEQAVVDLVQRWSTAELDGDPAALGELLTDDFLGVGPRGYLRTRDQWLARYSSGSVRTTAFDLSELNIRVFGDTAIVVAAQTQQSSNNGDDASGAFRFTLIAARRDGQWRLIGLHAGPNACPPAEVAPH
ncbi:hypothetical protein Srufu_068670 [Streptomyces libani subsp. rufus]|nr:hypothetical protein Srufu_068670 [Streptomyces libani subsp. rufus]